MNNVTVIVPNWARLLPDMEAETGARYAAFIPLGGIPLYRHTASLYQRDGISARIVFVLAEDAPELDVSSSETIGIEIVRLKSSGSIGETVLAGLAATASPGAVIVHMADTLFDLEETPVGDAVYVQLRSDLYRWTSVSSNAVGCIKVTNDRDEIEPCGPRPACVGLFSFEDGARLAAALVSALKHVAHGREPFFVALENYSAVRPMETRHVRRWLDCGHVDSYYESRLCYQNLRHFNTLSYDPARGRVTKKSLNSEAFRKQVRWFKEIPVEVAPFLPQVFDSSDGADPYITMELLSIPTLSDLFVNRRLKLGAWNDVVRSISYIQSSFAERAVRSSLAPQLAHDVYFAKTNARLKEFVEQNPDADDLFVQHGGEEWSITRVRQTLAAFVERAGLLESGELTPIHGDFCFSNLLYDCKVRLVKMIDPRGEFGVPGVFGDHRYDLAKLAHSYAGKYDFIVADRFSVDVRSGCLLLDVQADEYHKRVGSIFEAVLLPESTLRKQVDALQALLFLSMLPLHVDKPRRQLAMLATGLDLYARSWEQEWKHDSTDNNGRLWFPIQRERISAAQVPHHGPRAHPD